MKKWHYTKVERDEGDKLYYARHRVMDGEDDTIMDFDTYTQEERDNLRD